ncbi:LysR substrate-binding domain-containing protein, partial [Wenyingzhuangia sp. 1_MG-2023]|nr:LysR substrate-binding domain-containing protein [Wenyingzhuangia sp. 1_MG-2023]
ITLADVAKEPMVMLTVDEAEESALNYWSHLPQEPRIVLRSANVEAIRTAVASGLGVTILSDMVFRTWSLEGDRIEARDLATRVPPMDIGLSWRLGATLSPSAQEFQSFIKAASVGIVK